MIGQNPTTQARAVVAMSNAVGAKLPAPVLESYDRLTRIAKKAETIYPPRGALIDAVLAALDADRDPVTDPDVQRAHLAMQIGSSEGVGRQVTEVAAGQMRDTFSLHAEAIVKAWQKPFNAAAAELATAHERIGDVPLEDTDTILRAGGDIAAVWAKAQQAAAVVDQLDVAWLALATLTRFAPIDPRFPALRIADVDAEQWASAGLERKSVTAWNAQLSGLRLSLAGGAEYVARIAAVQVEPSLAGVA
jgi:hypothetical protein